MKLPTKVLCALAVAALAVPALAEDLNPPWWRGEISTTSQVWEFNQNVPPGTEVRPDYSPGQPFLASTHLIWEPGPTPWRTQPRRSTPSSA